MRLENTMRTVLSKDGTAIAFDQSGQGPALILVAGATATRVAEAELSAHLAPHFTVLAYDRRGRGASSDTAPYAVEREVEDIEALINEAGGSAFVFGHSSGAVLALEAARLFPTKITKLAVYEPPFIIDDSRPPVPQDYVPHLNELITAGRRDEAVEYFMTDAMLVPAEMVAQMRQSPMWAQIEAVAHTIPYDGTIMGDTMGGNPSTQEVGFCHRAHARHGRRSESCVFSQRDSNAGRHPPQCQAPPLSRSRPRLRRRSP